MVQIAQIGYGPATNLVDVRHFGNTAVFVVAALLGGAACQEDTGGDLTPDSTEPPAVAEGQVLVKSVAFNPRELRTTVGKPVTWTFDDGGLQHTITADDNSFDSGRMSSGNYVRTFEAPGTVNYHCTIHTRMRGTILVG